MRTIWQHNGWSEGFGGFGFGDGSGGFGDSDGVGGGDGSRAGDGGGYGDIDYRAEVYVDELIGALHENDLAS